MIRDIEFSSAEDGKVPLGQVWKDLSPGGDLEGLKGDLVYKDLRTLFQEAVDLYNAQAGAKAYYRLIALELNARLKGDRELKEHANQLGLTKENYESFKHDCALEAAREALSKAADPHEEAYWRHCAVESVKHALEGAGFEMLPAPQDRGYYGGVWFNVVPDAALKELDITRQFWEATEQSAVIAWNADRLKNVVNGKTLITLGCDLRDVRDCLRYYKINPDSDKAYELLGVPREKVEPLLRQVIASGFNNQTQYKL